MAAKDDKERSQSGGISRVILLALALIGISAFLATLDRDVAKPYVLAFITFLSIAGVFCLFAMALGFLRFGTGEGKGGPRHAETYLEKAKDGSLITDRLGRVQYANPAYRMLLGLAEDEAPRPLERVFAADPGASETVHRLVKAVSEGRSAQEEIRTQLPTEEEESQGQWLRIQAHPLGEGRSASIGWRITDITREREQHEHAFQELQDAISFLDHAPAGFFSASPAGELNYINATLAGWLGRDVMEFEGAPLGLGDILAGNGAALIEHLPVQAGQTVTETFDVDLKPANGPGIPAQLVHKVSFTAEGLAGDSRTLVTLARTEGGEDSLRAAEIRFARFFNNAPLAIATLNGEGLIGRANATFMDLFGSAPEGKRERSVYETVIEKDRETLKELVANAISEGGEMTAADLGIVGADEKTARFFVSSVKDGDSESAIVYAIDVSDQKSLEKQFAQSQKMQAVGELAGGIAHDFNNVLTAIIGFSDLLLANHRPTDPSFDDIMNIKQNANRAAGLVRQLLAFSRRQTLRPQVLRLYTVISELQVLLNRLLGEKVELKLNPANDLWLIKADHNQFEQVIMNLVVNARDAMPDGGEVTINLANVSPDEITALGRKEMPHEEFVVIEVTDTGTGMPPEVLEKIFDPFFSTKEIGKGTGLGLSTVYGIVKQTGGFIYPESTPGEGTTFRIYLPRHIETAAESAKAAEDVVTPARDLTGEGTVLLVEDEDAVRAFGARALTSRGYTVIEAVSGADALDIMAEQGDSVDLIVSDVIMPEMDGPTMVNELRKTRDNLRVVFVSGYAEEEFSQNLAENEQFFFLPKPFTLKQLAETVKEALEK